MTEGFFKRIAIATLTLVTAASASAQSKHTVVPSITVSPVYDNNLFVDQQSDGGKLLLVRPGLEGIYESPRTVLKGVGSFDMQRSNHKDLNTFDARRNAYGDSTFRLSPGTTVLASARYD